MTVNDASLGESGSKLSKVAATSLLMGVTRASSEAYVAAFAAFGSYSVKCHCHNSFVIENQELPQWQSAVNLLQFRVGEHLEPILPVTGLFIIELTAVNN